MSCIAELIASEFGVSYGKTNVWLIIKALGLSCQWPAKKATQRDEQAIVHWKTIQWPVFKKARCTRRMLLFIDETGLSERPTHVRTWAPKGQTPVLQYSFNWTHDGDCCHWQEKVLFPVCPQSNSGKADCGLSQSLTKANQATIALHLGPVAATSQ